MHATSIFLLLLVVAGAMAILFVYRSGRDVEKSDHATRRDAGAPHSHR